LILKGIFFVIRRDAFNLRRPSGTTDARDLSPADKLQFGCDYHDSAAPSVLEEPRNQSNLFKGACPTLSEALHDCGELKHVLGNFRYGKLLKLGRRCGIFDTDLVEQFSYKLLFYREINVLGEQARRARYA